MSFAVPSIMPSFQRPPSHVAIRYASSYDVDLAEIISETLADFQLDVKGKSVLLKANFVGVDPNHVMNTHPGVVAAARDSFLRLGASTVVVGEGPALERDTEAILEAIRLREYLGPLDGAFVDLNVDDVWPVALRTRASSLKRLYLPAAVLRADFVVSMPKLKTHHWAGVTLSLKNMFGIVPGHCYGWPKNILHWAGISKAILDLNSTVRPDFAIVDGIVGMEGNGPTQGQPKASDVLVMGDDPVAVDATCARVMGLVPERIDYLRRAGLLLGNIGEEKIELIGEGVAQAMQPFALVPEFEHLKAKRS
ncbi:MAG TPA: DUF362 domain-containing protein [Candidatus Acidoferrales bacterium]|nr:DUF362 domain-containing protein [Candidatus Acidoferrales bacterium]